MSSGAATGGALPPALYAGPEAFQRERRTIFQKAWLLLARGDLLRAPGAYVAQSIGGWPVFAVADAAGEPGAFRNVCRHQGLPLFDTGAGRCVEIRCRYHGWTYGADGRFMSAPPQVMPPDPDNAMHQLERVASTLFRGLLFIHLDGASAPLEPAAGELAAALADVDVDALPFHGETVTDIDANWKIVMEQALAAAPAGAGRRYGWPTLVLDIGDGEVVIHQVIPRAFQRTRIHHHHYAAGGGAALVERTTAEAAVLKTASIAAQAQCAQGLAPALPSTPTLADFRDRVRVAHAPVT